MKKGFTLMELLGSVVIMSIVLGIATISVVAIINNAKQKAYNTQVSLILAKSKDWALANETKLTPDGGINFIELSTLVSSGYVDNTTISDPRNGSTMSGCVVIIYNSTTSQYEYKYSDSACSAEQEKYGPEWTSGNPTEVEVASTYQYGVVTAKSRASNNALLTVTGPTINIVKGNTVVKAGVDNLDTSYVGRTYSLTYSAYDPIYKYTFNKTYYVEVKDTQSPIITLGETSGTEQSKVLYADTQSIDGQADIYVLTASDTKHNIITMKINDNSCDGLTEDARTNNNCTSVLTPTTTATTIDLTKQLTWQNASPVNVVYTAKDSSRNETKYTLHYYVAPRGCFNTNTDNFVYDSPGDYYCQIYYPADYSLDALGAQGDSVKSEYSGGKGGHVAGIVSLNFGDVVRISVGAKTNGGASSQTFSSGNSRSIAGKTGGKSTRIFVNNVEVLRAAGGGAGGSLSAGTDGGSNNATGGTWPEVCDGKTINHDSSNIKRIYNQDALVCPSIASDAKYKPEVCTSAAKGATGTDGSGGGSSNEITFLAHKCSAGIDYCGLHQSCVSDVCSCAERNYCVASDCACAVPNDCRPDTGDFGCKTESTCHKWTTCQNSWDCSYYDDWSDWNGPNVVCSAENCGDCSEWIYDYSTVDCSAWPGGGGSTCYQKCRARTYWTKTCYGNVYSCYDSSNDYKCCTLMRSSVEFVNDHVAQDDWGWSTQQKIDAAVAVCGGCAQHSSCQSNQCTCHRHNSCINDSCACDQWNYKDVGSDYTESSYGYGGQGGTNWISSVVSSAVSESGKREGNGKITIEYFSKTK